MLPNKFWIILPRCFKEDFQKSANQKEESPVEAMFVNRSGRNEQSLQRIFHRCFLASFGSFGQAILEENNFRNQKQELPEPAMFVNGLGRNQHSLQRIFHKCLLPSFALFGKAVSQEKNLRNRPIRNRNSLWRPCLLTDRDEMSSIQRGPFIDGSYKVSFHLANLFQRRRI